MHISPSFLGFRGDLLAHHVTALLSAGASIIHVDCMDGHFINQFYDGLADLPLVTTLAHAHGATVDLHLLVENPTEYLDRIKDVPIDRVSIHSETTRDFRMIAKILHHRNIAVGLAIRADTQIQAADLSADLPHADYLHISTSLSRSKEPASLSSILAWIDALRRPLQRRLPVVLDGGLTFANLASCATAKIDVVVMGSALFREADPAAAFIRGCKLAKGENNSL